MKCTILWENVKSPALPKADAGMHRPTGVWCLPPHMTTNSPSPRAVVKKKEDQVQSQHKQKSLTPCKGSHPGAPT